MKTELTLPKSLSSPINKEALAKWMEENLPRNYTQREYEDFYIQYKRSLLSNVPKKTGRSTGNILNKYKPKAVSEKELGLFKPTPIESLMARELKVNSIPYIHQFPLGKYRLDFAIQYQNKRIDLECDGRDFHKLTNKQERSDRARDAYVISQGWVPMRFSGSEITKNPGYCVQIIKRYLKI